jgi:hypothetical protein
MPLYNRGKARSQPASYTRLIANAIYNEKRYRETGIQEYLVKAKAKRAEAQKLPSTDPKDPNFRRLYYVRYADDWLIGFAGPHSEAETVKDQCRYFLSSIGLRLNMEKTAISPGSEGCIYLGTKIHVPLNQERFKAGSRRKARANLGVRLNAPLPRVIKKLATAGYCDGSGSPLPRMALFAASKDEIVKNYAAVLRGILSYYSFADNSLRLGSSLFYILRSSACKVLAAKFKLRTVRQVLLRFGPYLEREGASMLPNYTDPSLRGSDFKLAKGASTVSLVPALFRKASYTLRASGLECIKCGSTRSVELHHVRMLKDLNKKLDPISRTMAARARKQVPLCRCCHTAQHVNLRQPFKRTPPPTRDGVLG